MVLINITVKNITVSGWVNNDGREQRILLTLKAIGCGLIFVKCMRKTPSNCSEQHVGLGKNSSYLK